MTHLRQMMLDELQGGKSLRFFVAELRIRRFDLITEISEWANHLPNAKLLRSFGDGWAPFFVTNALVQDQPNHSTLSMCDGPDGLIVSQARNQAAIHNLKDAPFGPGCGIRCLVEQTSHVSVAFWRAVAVVCACALVVARAGTDPRGEAFLRGEGRCSRADFGNDLLR